MRIGGLCLVGFLIWPGALRAQVEPLSPEGYRAEFRYLRDQVHGIDLKGSAVETDGWTHNIAEAEWPVMAVSYFAYGCAELARSDPKMRDEALTEMRWAIDALQTPRLSGFMTPHFGEPFGAKIHTAVFLHGHFLSVAVRYREVSGDKRYDELIHRVAGALMASYANDPQGILKSYKDMWWITDNLPALSALSRYDRIYGANSSSVRKKFLQSLNDYYVDKSTGMICTYVNPTLKRQDQGPRGISQMYALHFLKDIDPKFADRQYQLAKKLLYRNTLGVSAVREFPEGVDSQGDIDSGPVVMGMGASASGFGITASAVMGDREAADELLRASVLVGMPVQTEDRLRYLTMPMVGQAVIFYGKTLLLRSSP